MSFHISIHSILFCLGINTYCLCSFHLASYSILRTLYVDHSILTHTVPINSMIQDIAIIEVYFDY